MEFKESFEEILSSMVFAQIQTCTSFHGMAHACACVRSRVRVHSCRNLNTKSSFTIKVSRSSNARNSWADKQLLNVAAKEGTPYSVSKHPKC